MGRPRLPSILLRVLCCEALPCGPRAGTDAGGVRLPCAGSVQAARIPPVGGVAARQSQGPRSARCLGLAATTCACALPIAARAPSGLETRRACTEGFARDMQLGGKIERLTDVIDHRQTPRGWY